MGKSEEEMRQSIPQDQQPQELKSIGLVMNTIVHSFNNAIGLIRGYADLSLKATEPESRVYGYLENIISGTDSVKELSEKMRIFGKQEKQDLKSMPIHPIVEETVDSFAASLAPPIKIQKNIDSACGEILADADQIQQMVINLCTNAYYAVRDNGGSIEVALSEEDVDAAFAQSYRGLSEGKHLKLTVKDTGIGMEQVVLERIFEPFFTADKTGESVGMGLTIVQAIVKNHKGILITESKPNEGTTLHIYLPLAKKDNQKTEG